MNYTTSQKGIDLIKSFEGLGLIAYICPAGVLTIGYGHTAGVQTGDIVTEQQAEDLLREDLLIYEKPVNALALNLNQYQFDALVSFTYNCGSGCLATLCANRTLEQIADALLLYTKANGTTLAGLVRRREAERELFLTEVETSTTNDTSTTNISLPYKVKTNCPLNIRTGSSVNYSIIRTAEANEILTVWAQETTENGIWGKNGEEYFCLTYCTII